MSRKRKNRRSKQKSKRKNTDSEFRTPRQVPYVHWTQVSKLQVKSMSGRSINFDPYKEHAEAQRTIIGGRRR